MFVYKYSSNFSRCFTGVGLYNNGNHGIIPSKDGYSSNNKRDDIRKGTTLVSVAKSISDNDMIISKEFKTFLEDF